MNVHASITIIINRAISSEPKKEGLSHPNVRAKREIGPNLISNIDLPIIQLTATGDNIKGIKNATLKNFLAFIWALSKTARQNAIIYSGIMAKIYQTMFFNAFQ